jgi:serine/threonine protein kinase
MYTNSKGQNIPLGEELGKGGAAIVYSHGSDKSKAIKIFKPQILQKEQNLSTRIEKLNQLSQIADFEFPFGQGVKKTVGAWPKEIVKDRSGNIVGYIMDSVHGGIDLSHVIMARDKNAFYKYRHKSNYHLWKKYFIYESKSLKNRFILAYYLSIYFEKIYNPKHKNGGAIDIEICNFDIKPQNILVSIDSIGGKNQIVPYILDLDNLTLKNKSQILKPTSPQITPEYFAPEGPVNKYYDYYSIAVVFHQLILNLHPFTFSNAGGTRFRDGTEMSYFRNHKCYPWGRNRKFLDKNIQNDFRWGNFRALSPELQRLFLRAFDSDLPTQRPSMSEWSKALLAFLQNRSIHFDRLFKF